VTPVVACNNSAGDRAVGRGGVSHHWTVGRWTLDLAAFHSWIGRTSPNYGLALFTSEADNNQWKIFTSIVAAL
jgi:hypothetical protein